MAVEIMANPLKTIGKIRGKSLDELLTRGGQAFSAYREQKGRGEGLPSDADLERLIDKSQFGTSPIIAESLWQKFYENSDERFFRSFKSPADSIAAFRESFGDSSAKNFVDAAEQIVEGRIDVLGLRNLYVGTEIDWHREPISGKRSPLKHWKQFDEFDTAETGDKKIVWELNRHQHFFTLGFAFWLTKDERFAETFVRHLESWMEQNPPGVGINWSSSLEVSFRAISWIWAINFFRNSNSFTPELFKKALKFLYLHGRHIEKYLSKYYSPNTHLTGEALGLYYLGTQLPFFERAKHWRKHGADILHSEITRQILPDGVYFEQSTWYQRYTADFYTHFIILQSLFGRPDKNQPMGELYERLQRAFDFLMNVTRPDGTTPVIGDDDGGRVLPLTNAAPDDFRGTLAVGAALFKRGDYKFVSGGPREEMLWLLGSEGINTYNDLEEIEPADESKDFAHGGYFVMRDGWTESDNYLLIDCGEVGAIAGGHGHADALSIELAVRGRTLLVDSGTYTYHESKELRDYFRSSTAHNGLVVDGISSSEPGNTFGWKTRANAGPNAWIAEERFDFFEGSHNGYDRLEAPAAHSRSILFLKNDYWIMHDLVATPGEHDYALNFHIKDNIKPSIENDGRSVGDAGSRIFTFGDNGAWQQKESWISNIHCNKMNAPFLRFLSRGQGTQEFFTFMLPADAHLAVPDVFEVPSARGRAFVIKYRGYTDLFVFNDEQDQLIKTGIFDTNFRYSWARMSEGESVPDELVLIGGNRLAVGGHKVFDQPSEMQFATALRLGNDLYLKTEKGRRSVSIGFKERRIRDRRRPASK